MPIRAIAVAVLAASCAWAQAQPSLGQTASVTQSKSPTTSPKQSDAESKAEARARENEAKTKKALALRLLKRSHSVNQELSLEDREYVLSEQVGAAGRLNLKLARTWADELFVLANQLPSQKVSGAQQRAISTLAASDPDHALELFRKMQPGVSPDDPLTPDQRMGAADSLFGAVAEKKGKEALLLLQPEARRLGEDNAYPYRGMMDVGRIIGFQTNKRGLGPNDPLLGEILDEATAYYRQSPASLAQDYQFAEMLESNADSVADEKAKPALELVVNRLINAQQDANVRFHGGFETATGKFASDNVADHMLVRLTPLIRKLEPELLEKAGAERPSFGRLLQALGPDGRTTSEWSGWGSSSAPSPSIPTWQKQSQAALGRNPKNWRFDPNRSMAIAQGFTDPYAQAAVYSQVASWVANKDPEKADQLLQKSEKLIADSKDLQLQLKIATSRAEWAAATKNTAVLREMLRHGFELGDAMLRADLDQSPAQPMAWYQLRDLVNLGVRNEPDLTTAYLDNISVPVARSHLFTVGANALASEVEAAAERARRRARAARSPQ